MPSGYGPATGGAQVAGGQTYRLQFWIKPMAIGTSYISQYRLEWFDDKGRPAGGTGFVFFKGPLRKWTRIQEPKLVAPKNAKRVALTFRFVTGAVNGGHGEMFLDGVMLQTTKGGNTPDKREQNTSAPAKQQQAEP